MGTRPARRTGWLYEIPPWRAPRLRRHHHHHVGLIEAFALPMGLLLFAMFFFEIWMLEVCLWLMVWYYYALFLGARWIARWIWRHNPIGQTIDSRHAARERHQPRPYDPHGAPPRHIDLGHLGSDHHQP